MERDTACIILPDFSIQLDNTTTEVQIDNLYEPCSWAKIIVSKYMSSQEMWERKDSCTLVMRASSITCRFKSWGGLSEEQEDEQSAYYVPAVDTSPNRI